MSDTPPNVPTTTPPAPPNVPPPPPPTATPPQAPPSGSGSFTQADIDRMIQERLAKQAKAHQDQMAKILGGRDPESVSTILAEHDAAVEARKTEHERAMEAAARAKAEADAAAASARQTELRAALTMALTAPGNDAEGNPLPPVQRDYLATVLDLALPVAAASDTDDPVGDAVAKVRVSAAPMFAESTPQPSGPGSTRPAPAATRPHSQSSTDGKTPAEIGIERYKKLKGIKDD